MSAANSATVQQLVNANEMGYRFKHDVLMGHRFFKPGVLVFFSKGWVSAQVPVNANASAEPIKSYFNCKTHKTLDEALRRMQ